MVDKYDAMALLDRETQVDEKSEQGKGLVWENMRLGSEPEEKLLTYEPVEPDEFLVGNEAYWQSEPERYQRWMWNRRRPKAFKPPEQPK